MDSSDHRAVDPTSELAADFSETARTLFAAGSVTDRLAQVVQRAEQPYDLETVRREFEIAESVKATPD